MSGKKVTMFAVVKTGGKQYRVAEGQIFLVEKLLGQEGDQVTLDNVLCLESDGQVEVGVPTVSGAKIVTSIIEQTRGEKVIIFKKKRRHTYRRKRGHRQDLTVLRVEQIAKPGDEIRPISASPVGLSKSRSKAKSAAVLTSEASIAGSAPKKSSSQAESVPVASAAKVKTPADKGKVQESATSKGIQTASVVKEKVVVEKGSLKAVKNKPTQES